MDYNGLCKKKKSICVDTKTRDREREEKESSFYNRILVNKCGKTKL